MLLLHGILPPGLHHERSKMGEEARKRKTPVLVSHYQVSQRKETIESINRKFEK